MEIKLWHEPWPTLNGTFRRSAALSGAQRRELLRSLIAELDGPADSGVDEAWFAEAERRDREIESGAVQSIPAEDVLREAQQLLRQ